MSNDERREVRAKVRTYKDKETDEYKNVYRTIGTAWVSEHGSKIKIEIETIPTTWDGVAFINKPYEKKDDRPLKQHEVIEKSKDVAPKDVSDEPVNLDDLIPF